MAYEIPDVVFGTLNADVDLSGSQFLAMTINASTGNAALAGANANIIGVLQNKPKAGNAAAIGKGGITKMVAGAAVAVGDLLQTDASARAITRTSTNPIIGTALEAASGAGVVFTVLLAS